MKEAIEILEEELRTCSNRWGHNFEWGFRSAIHSLKRSMAPWVETSVMITKNEAHIYHKDTKTSDSPDTEYKIELTKWIEKKKWFEAYERIKDTDAIHKGNPYSFFESWQKVCPRITEEGEG